MTVKDIPVQLNALSPFVSIEAKGYDGKQSLTLQVYNCAEGIVLQKKITQLPFLLATHSLTIGSYRYTLKEGKSQIQESFFSVP